MGDVQGHDVFFGICWWYMPVKVEELDRTYKF